MGRVEIYFRYHIGGWMRAHIRNKIDRYRFGRLKKQNKNFEDFSIISPNCIGGIMCHDLGLRFNSPTVNMFMEAEGYIKFLENLQYYLSLDANQIRFVQEATFPIGYLEDVKIYFVHYKNEQEVIEKWNARKARVCENNLFIIMTDRDGCNDEIMDRFMRLEYKNKVLFTRKKREGSDVCYMPCYRNENSVGTLTEFCNIWGKRYYGKYFDYIAWLAGN